jgi:hypothetical protein
MDKIYQCKKCGLNVVVASEFELRDWGGIDCTGFKTLRAQNAVPNTTHDFKYFVLTPLKRCEELKILVLQQVTSA